MANSSTNLAGLKPMVMQAHGFAESLELKELPQEPALEALAAGSAVREIPILTIHHGTKARLSPKQLDPVIQSFAPSLNIPSPSLTFEGVNNHCSCTPPDTNGEVGPSNYVQIVNTHFQVFNKFTGAAQTAVLAINSLFTGLGNPCATTDDGDPVVLYDPLADRWLITQFADVPGGPPFFMSIAVSKTSDPTGAYYLYCFQMPNTDLNDYPKLAVWPDGYYMTDNQFNAAGTAYLGVGVFAFDRAKMLVGDPTATYVYFDLNSVDPNIFGVLPSNLDGPPPPVGTPNYFSYFTSTDFGDPQDGLRMFQFHADFATPANSTFTERPESPIHVAAFTPFSPGTNTIPQSGTTQKVDSLGDRLMHRLQYRNFSSNETLVVTHTVNGGSAQAAIRYYQLQRTLPSGNFVVYDQATYAPDSNYRWMGSVALDYLGNLAVGYSVSSSSMFPAIRYAGRLASDPTNGLFQGEATMQTGGGAQTGSNRWGDYSGLTVDPIDDTTFWYTTEYYGSSSAASWQTRIGKFQIATNSPPAPKGTLLGTVTDGGTSLPISNAVVRTTSGYFRASDTSGAYSMTVPPGTYDMSAFATGRGTLTASGVSVTNGAITTQNFVFALQPAIVTTNGATITSESCAATNGVIDPGETVTVNFSLKNIGGADASNVVATLLATNGVTVPSAAQSYGTLIAGGSAVSETFTFTANGTCGSNITATLQIQTNATNFGTVTYNFNLGALSATFTQNFDGVTAPALPAGWTTSAGGAESSWVTSTTTRDTVPNAAFSPDPASIGSNTLISPVIPVLSSKAQLTFRNNYSLEASSNPSVGYDGGVLEIEIGGGAFQDILTAGGSFASGGYTRTISSSYGNPFAGRQAWSGNSGGFITTTVNLPAAAAGQNIQLRWRCGTDNSVGSTGWYIDTISFSDLSCCISPTNNPPVASFSASPTNGTEPLVVTFSDTSTGTITNHFWDFGDSSTTNITTNTVVHTYPAGTFTLTLVASGPAGVSTNIQANCITVLTAFQAWQIKYFGSTNNPAADPNADPDGDGFSNLQEFLAGTDPNDSSSALRITDIATNGPDMVVSFTSCTNKGYDLQFNDDLMTTNWTATVTNIPGTATITSATDLGGASLTSRFYRVRLLP